jgi:restriction system protein
MAHRKSDAGMSDVIYEVLLVVPAWVGPPLALIFYLGLRFVVPAVFGDGKPGVGSILAGVAPAIAPWFGGFVLVLWVVAELEKFRRRRLLDEQSGLESIRNLPWQEFEHLVGEVYRRQGYIIEETGSSAGDGGIDVVLTGGQERILVQCKQWRTRRVGPQPIRELFGVMISEGATHAILVTCGSFTPEARSFAEGKPITLVEGPELWALIQTVRTPQAAADSTAAKASTNPPRPTESEFAIDSPPKCPACGSSMVLRTVKEGRNAGSRFWGCPRFPRCRGTRDYRSR